MYVYELPQEMAGDSDGGVLSSSEFGQQLENDELHIPPDQPLPGIFPVY